MLKETVKVHNPAGLHLRPAGILCKEAIKFKSRISFQKGDSTANAKSVLSVLGACVKCGDEILLICDGPDEKIAMEKLSALIDHGLEA
ncbi:phosphocarrier protein [Catenibacillus scindens]|uniref:Phosphocarrier protein n=1 Tax=Catenibacillus scindens TaxID=673271 RepID=A0A7W8H6T2_9FIRM|nr:HPr family phosphocarrier protein [Catenibacillus scindens]MBB5262949.1 phosphocarrier protein [Catenibacillus scindens]